jgi:hypothetical protein
MKKNCSVRAARSLRDRCLISSVAFVLIFGAFLSDGRSGEFSELELKAAYMINFARFVHWPEEAWSGDFVIGVIGENPFSSMEESLQDQRIHGRRIRVSELTPETPGPAHMLYIGKEHADQVPEILKKVKGSPVLTVGESEGFIEAGGMILLVKKRSSKLKFELCPRTAEASKIGLGSQLVKLAAKVHS